MTRIGCNTCVEKLGYEGEVRLGNSTGSIHIVRSQDRLVGALAERVPHRKAARALE